MTWLIERRSPPEPNAYWSKAQRWIARRPALRFAQLLHPIPEQAARFESYDVAHEIVEWLRSNTQLAHGEVIALVPDPAGT